MFGCKILKILKFRDYETAFRLVNTNSKRHLSSMTKSSPFEIREEKIPETDEIFLDLKDKHFLEQEETLVDRFHGLNLERGKFGVFDIEDLVETLHKENAQDIFVASVPKEIKYVDYIVIVSGGSQKHMQAIAHFVKRVYKQKRGQIDIIPKVEGEDSKDWIAMDLGNIALHIFSKKGRLIYDLDSLWAVGPKYDDEYNKKEPISDLLDKYTQQLAGFEPAS